jgi:hypothetical protein
MIAASAGKWREEWKKNKGGKELKFIRGCLALVVEMGSDGLVWGCDIEGKEWKKKTLKIRPRKGIVLWMGRSGAAFRRLPLVGRQSSARRRLE